MEGLLAVRVFSGKPYLDDVVRAHMGVRGKGLVGTFDVRQKRRTHHFLGACVNTVYFSLSIGGVGARCQEQTLHQQETGR